MTATTEPVRLAGSALGRSCHVRAFFHSGGEGYRVPMPIFNERVERGDRTRARPVVIVGGTLRENPLCVPPGETLRELEGRAADSAAGRPTVPSPR